MKLKKIAALICATVFLTGVFSGCGKQEAGNAGAYEEEAVSDNEAYAKFEDSLSEDKADASEVIGAVNDSALLVQKNYVSSLGAERERDGDKVRSYLTGKFVPSEIGDRRPVAIMLNNIKDAMPMSGVSYADVLYECVVEGGLTRMMGIFENYDDLEKIGSVRSCRNYFVYYALEFDSIYCHYGQSSYALPLLEQDNVDNLSGLAAIGDTVFYRTTDRVAPHNAYASAKGIKKGIEDMGYRNEYKDNYIGKFTFAKDDDPNDLSEAPSYDATHIEPGYLINKPYLEYNKEDQKYYRWQYDTEHVDDLTGEQLSFDNIILQYSDWMQVDDKGYLGFDCHSGGKMVFITKGKAVEGIWISFGGEEGSVRYYDSDGKEIVLNQGKTLIEIIQDSEGDKVVIR
ncbi:MAG: DUF3048 domain-containing protein [Lachnospiraceae bacterium]|nr:DUF3048 domain-containing protein [Lachnospiraceae bacterium]